MHLFGKGLRTAVRKGLEQDRLVVVVALLQFPGPLLHPVAGGHRKGPEVILLSARHRRHKIGQTAVGLPIRAGRLLPEGVETRPHPLPGVILIEKDIVSFRIGGKESHHPPRPDPFSPDDFFQEDQGVGVETPGLRPHHRILQDFGEAAPQLPSMEKGRPVDVLLQVGQRIVGVDAQPQKFRNFRIPRPVQSCGVFPGLGERQKFLRRPPAFKILARFLLLGADFCDELPALFGGKKLLRHSHHPRGIDHVHHRPFVDGGDFHGGVGGTGRRPADQQGQVHLLPLHLRGHRHHFIQRRGDQPAQTDHIHPVRFGLSQNFLARHHHAKIDDFVAVAGQHHAHDVFSNVVDIPLDRGHENPPRARFAPGGLLLLHEGGEVGNGPFHHPGALHHLREKHFSLPEKVPDVAHTPHQRALDHLQRPAVLPARLLGVLVNVVGDPLEERVQQPLLHRPLAPGLVLDHRLAARLDRFRELQHPLRRVRPTVQENILHPFLEVRGNFLIDRQLPGIDDGHVQPGLDGMIKKTGMHRLPDRVVPPEGEGDIADPAARLAPGQGLLDLPDRLDELHRIPVVLLNARCHGEDVHVKNDVLRGKSRLLGEKPVGPAADRHLPLAVRRLSLFIKRHDDDRRPVPADLPGLFEKRPLPLLQADRIHHRFALHAPETGLQHRPLGTVQNQRHPGNFRFAGHQVQEPCHARFAVQERLVEIDVDQVRPRLHLLAGHRHGFVKFSLLDQGGKPGRTGDIGPLPDRGERTARADRIRLQPAQYRGRRGRLGHPRRQPPHPTGDGRNVLRGRSATAAHHVEKSGLPELPQHFRHLVGRLVVAPKGVGKAGIGITTDKTIRHLGQGRQVGPHLLRTQSAVDAHTEGARMPDGMPEGLGGLAGERPPRGVGDRYRDHHRQAVADLVKDLLHRPERRLEIQRVKSGFRQKQIHPALDQRPHLLAISLRQLPESDRPEVRPIHIRGHRGRPVGRPHRPSHPRVPAGIRPGKFIDCLSRQPRGRQVDFPHRALQAVVGLGDGGRIEGVGFQDLRPGLEVSPVNPPDHVGTGDRQNVVVALQVPRMGGETLPPEIFFRERMTLHHRPHGPVDQHDPAGQLPFQPPPPGKNLFPFLHPPTLRKF